MIYVLRSPTKIPGEWVYYRGGYKEYPDERGELRADVTFSIDLAKEYKHRTRIEKKLEALRPCKGLCFEICRINSIAPSKSKRNPLAGVSIEEISRRADAMGMSYGQYVSKYGET